MIPTYLWVGNNLPTYVRRYIDRARKVWGGVEFISGETMESLTADSLKFFGCERPKTWDSRPDIQSDWARAYLSTQYPILYCDCDIYWKSLPPLPSQDGLGEGNFSCFISRECRYLDRLTRHAKESGMQTILNYNYCFPHWKAALFSGYMEHSKDVLERNQLV